MVSLLAVRVPAQEYYNVKPLGILYFLLCTAAAVFMLSNLFVAHRFNDYTDGLPFHNVIVVPSRNRPYPNVPLPSYCNATLDVNIADPVLQSTMGRMCAHNITCNKWFETQDLVEISNARWFVMTSLLGRPNPIAPFRNIFAFDIDKLKTGSYLFAEEAEKKQMERAVWGDNFDFTCAPSYYPLGVENTTLGLIAGFSHPKLGNIEMPKTKIFNIHGKLLQTLPPNHIANLRLGDLFDLDNGKMDRILQLPPLANAPMELSFPLRALGAKATIELRFRNYHANSLKEEVTLEIHPTIMEGIPATHTPVFLPSFDLLGKTPVVEWYKPFGLDIEIKSSAIIGTPNYYPVLMHLVSAAVMVDKAGGLVVAMVLVGYRFFQKHRIRVNDNGEEIDENGVVIVNSEGEEGAAAAELPSKGEGQDCGSGEKYATVNGSTTAVVEIGQNE